MTIDFSKSKFEEDDSLSEREKKVLRDIRDDYWPEKNNTYRSILVTKEMHDIYYKLTDFVLLDDMEE